MPNPFGSFQAIVTALQNVARGVNQLVALAKNIRATSAQFASDQPGVVLTPSSYWTAVGTEVSLTDSATVSVDLSKGINFVLQATAGVGATRALGNPANPKVGQRGYLRYIQSSGGSNALTFGSQYVAAGGVASLSLVTSANAVNLLIYEVLAGPQVALTLLAGLAH